jgi:SAM-dependent methyltransferase
MAEETAAPDGAGTTGALPDPEGWPGSERREPAISDRHYLSLGALSRALREEIGRTLAGRGALRVLDVGCGCKPYYPFLAAHAAVYLGLDAHPGPLVDELGSVEALPHEDASFDVVLCTQVLEHVGDPSAAVGEIARVLAPGGVAFLSTHGVFLYHPDPVDYWRWTHAGLERLFTTAASWSEVRVTPNGEAVACIGYLICQYLDELGRRLGSDALRRGMLRTVNTVASRLDRRLPPRARAGAPGSLSSNYLVTAVRERPT